MTDEDKFLDELLDIGKPVRVDLPHIIRTRRSIQLCGTRYAVTVVFKGREFKEVYRKVYYYQKILCVRYAARVYRLRARIMPGCKNHELVIDVEDPTSYRYSFSGGFIPQQKLTFKVDRVD